MKTIHLFSITADVAVKNVQIQILKTQIYEEAKRYPEIFLVKKYFLKSAVNHSFVQILKSIEDKVRYEHDDGADNNLRENCFTR